MTQNSGGNGGNSGNGGGGNGSSGSGGSGNSGSGGSGNSGSGGSGSGGSGNGGNGGGNGGNNGGSGNGGNGGGGGGGGESKSPSKAELAISAVSVLFTVLLFAFLIWQAFQVPTATTPEAHVESVEQLPGDRIGVTVSLTNPGREGLLSATVAVDCDQPPPSIEFTHVPTDSQQRAILVCPAGTADNATANVTVWQTA